jgi:nucleoside-diphosphate-sugar epimerase
VPRIGSSVITVEGSEIMGKKLSVVVVGATGKQGGAVAKSLLDRGHEVRAVTRNSDSLKAKELGNAGATLCHDGA